MPEGDSPNQRTPTIDESPADVISSTLIFSDVIKTEVFSPEDHVILVVPDQADHLTADPSSVDPLSFEITPSETVEVDSTVSSSRLRETIKSNFLVIAKLLPSASPPPLVPFAGKEENVDSGDPLRQSADESEDQRPSDVPLKPAPPRSRRQSRARQPGIKANALKQEVPEIFGKMFPPAYNEVLLKQINEIVCFKYGKETTADTVIPAGIRCPHCRKTPLTLTHLKDHLLNCHTYNAEKRKSGCGGGPVSKLALKKMLYRCGTCSEAFISEDLRDSHVCALPLLVEESPSRLSEDRQKSVNPPETSSITPQTTSEPSTVPRATCPICDLEVEDDALSQHVDSHYSSVVDNESPLDGCTIHIAFCIDCEGEFKIHPDDKDIDKCSKCR